MASLENAPPCKKIKVEGKGSHELTCKPLLICVGATKEYYVHETLIRAKSSLLNHALTRKCIEDQDHIIELPETDVGAFGSWVMWLYTGHYSIMKEDNLADRNERICLWDRWYKFYALGDFLQDCDFKDAAIDNLISLMTKCNKSPDHLPAWIYSHSKEGSAHHMLTVDIFVHNFNREH
ncbi:hypothetical protein GQ44DRAFT_769717 [Phaeosphaeriaceae sp. PMI808]|nr:hypothetical protein GQ44DRAFT_769717 [Phaeosphaeriaceae sp. PMI808]